MFTRPPTSCRRAIDESLLMFSVQFRAGESLAFARNGCIEGSRWEADSLEMPVNIGSSPNAFGWRTFGEELAIRCGVGCDRGAKRYCASLPKDAVNKEIAGSLNISPRTVKQHRRTLFLRAGITEGRKRMKLANAAFAKEQMEQCCQGIS